MAQSGFDMTVADMPSMDAEARATAKEIQALGRQAHVALGDVFVRGDVERIVASHVEALGSLYAMVANAGICQVKPALELTERDIARMFEVNVFGVFNCYQAAAKQMIREGTKGRLIGCARYGCLPLPPSAMPTYANRHIQYRRAQTLCAPHALQREQVGRARDDAGHGHGDGAARHPRELLLPGHPRH